MAPKRPYLSQEDKATFINKLDLGIELLLAAKNLKINLKTARNIKKRVDNIIIYNDVHYLPPPSLYDRVALVPKIGRPYVLFELDLNILDKGISIDRKHRDMC